MKTKLVIATHNKGKISEIKNLLKPFKLNIFSATDFDISAPKETGKTFIENSIIKAKAVSKKSGHIALADDSGLCINALDGSPGILSARWAGKSKNFTIAIHKIEKELLKVSATSKRSRRAHFCCALSLAYPTGRILSFEGKVYGHLNFPAVGNNGFGYDPIFIPDGYKKTFGEMNFLYKERISHRQIAFNKLKNYLIKI